MCSAHCRERRREAEEMSEKPRTETDAAWESAIFNAKRADAAERRIAELERKLAEAVKRIATLRVELREAVEKQGFCFGCGKQLIDMVCEGGSKKGGGR